LRGLYVGKISLIIADDDENYVKSFESYLMVHYSQRFDIYSFTTLEYLTAFLNNIEKRIDILLYSSHFSNGLLTLNKVDVLIALADTKIPKTPCEFISINKFQHAEKLVSDIFHIYSQRSGDDFFHYGQKKVMVAAVFSPEGGSGKTSIAVGCSVLCARMGMKVFYLNLENVPSTTFYFKGWAERNFSNVIYYLKEKQCSLALKLEGAKSVDPDSNVHYFLPPDSILEMEELDADGLDMLIRHMRSAAQYDVVFIDMSSGLGLHNITVLKACDTIIQVSLPETASYIKLCAISTGLSILEKKHSLDLTGKTISLLNRFSKDACCATNEGNMANEFQVVIEECEKLKNITRASQLVDMDTVFASGINSLLERVLPNRDEKRSKYSGGVNLA
jgi:cellulose biosynthesis protein BcsQ